MYIDGKTGSWEVVIGLEVHAQVSSKTKLFSGALTEFGANPNEQVSIVDAAMPGMLPVLNSYCVEQAVKTGFGLNAKINKISIFDRKNYFYPDLPAGYQISQFYKPIVTDGWLDIKLEDGSIKRIRITRMHLEQDAGKSMHDQSPNNTFIDLNRSGVALMEIVSEPDLSSSYEAGEYVKKLRNILKYLGTSDGDMEKGSLRCDANVSVRKKGDPLGKRCEIKNVNSIRNMMRAIEYEAHRQVELLENGIAIIQETRLFDESTGTTRSMRTKEDATDYRYFPDPDLLPIKLEDEYIANIKNTLPELPDAKISRYASEYGLSEYDASVLVEEKDVAIYFEDVIKNGADPKMAANWIITELFGAINRSNISFENSKVAARHLASLISLISKGTISGKIAKTVFEIMFETEEDPESIVKARNLVQMSDTSAIEAIVDQVLSEQEKSVIEYKSGKDKLFGFFVGEVMKKSQGKANPAVVNDILSKKLKQ